MGEEVERDTIFEKAMRLLQGFDFEIDHTGGKADAPRGSPVPPARAPSSVMR